MRRQKQGRERLRLAWALALGLAAGPVGCARWRVAARPPPATRAAGPKLEVVRSEGAVVLRWDSEPGSRYTVLYAEDLLAPAWTPLPGAENLAGTGAQMEIRDETPESARRYYRLQAGSGP